MTVSAQPQWVTPSGSLGTIPEGVFYRVPIQAQAGPQDVYFKLIAGQLPLGVQITQNGFIEGIPRSTVTVQGVPQEVSGDVTSQFAIRAYTRRMVNGAIVVDRLADRTFTLTVAGQDVPDFITPPGLLGTYYDGDTVDLQVLYADTDPNDNIEVKLLSGKLPPGVLVSRAGHISGVIKPLVGPPGTAFAGYDGTPKDEYPNDFTTRSYSQNFQFALEITDGKDSNVRAFNIYVYSKDSMSADTTDFTADNTFITADVVPTRTPILLTPTGDLGLFRADNYFAFKFDALDFDGDEVEYSITTGAGIGFDETLFDETGIGFDRGTLALPPGLQIDPQTGWFYGYIPDQGATESGYKFAIRVLKAAQPSIISGFYYFTITIIGNIETEVNWITGQDLGTIDNGSISTLDVEAVNTGGRSLQYKLVSGSDSKLPQGLSLLSSGHITGRVSFNTFALDSGTTTLDAGATTFDLKFSFTVNAFAAQSTQLGYQVGSIIVLNGGSGYLSQPSIIISAPPDIDGSIQATAGIATIVDGVITEINVGNPGRGYAITPTITIIGGGGTGAQAITRLIESSTINAVSVIRRFTVTVNRTFNEPYESLYIKAMPPVADRELLDGLLQNTDVIPLEWLYRADDTNFGKASNVTYTHAYGLTASTVDTYIESLQLNHYWKNLTLGQLKVAQALDSSGNVLYEVVYSEVIDNLVNNAGQSVGKEVTLAYPVLDEDSTEVDVVYPNSLDNMRTQVIDTVGQITPGLPLWMTSKQANGKVLGFVPAWVIAYANPGRGNQLRYNIVQRFGERLNLIDFEVDRYELDRSQTYNYNPTTDLWIPYPAQATTFDRIIKLPNLNYIGPVDYVSTLPFVDVNLRNLAYIASQGGIDGAFGRELDGKTVVFQKQEFSDMSSDEAFTVYPYGYDPLTQSAANNGLPGSYDEGLYDYSYIMPLAERLGIYLITIFGEDVVKLTLLEVPQTNDSITVISGRVFNRTGLYLPPAPTPGLLTRTWSLIPEIVSLETVFDGGATDFIAPADRWTETDVFDKYLVFPKRNILQ
jgi:hypothetical protein